MGTSFTNPIGRTLRVKPRESSRLRSPRDSDVAPRLWQKSASHEQQVFRLSQAVEQLQRELNRLRRRGGSESAPGTSSGMVFRGWWDAGEQYNSQELVFRTPSGGSAGAYIGLVDGIAIGTAPEAGAPDWAAFPIPPQGVWG